MQHKPGRDTVPESYADWKAAKGADVRASGWTGWFIGNMLVAVIWSYPLYLVGVLSAERLTLLPDTAVEWAVWGGLALVLFALARGKGRPDHLEPERAGRPRRLSDRALRDAVERGEMTREEAVARSMGFRDRAEAEAWLVEEHGRREQT